MEFYDFALKYQKQLLREQVEKSHVPPLQNKDNQYKIFKKKRVYGYKQAK